MCNVNSSEVFEHKHGILGTRCSYILSNLLFNHSKEIIVQTATTNNLNIMLTN